MATHAHCIACFDTLYSRLVYLPLNSNDESDSIAKSAHKEAKKTWRKSMSLEEVEKSWSAYKNRVDKKLPALQRLAHASSAASSASSTTSSGTSTPISGSSTSLIPGSSSGSGSENTTEETPDTSTTSLSDNEPITDSPLFVTWDKKVSYRSKPELRGCIGTFESLPLSEGIPDYALTSAFDDHRFPPMRFTELESLVVSVTLLTDFEPCDDWQDWEVGVHGIKIRFVQGGRGYGATYLPQVAEEQGWDKEETVESLVRKAGWRGGKHGGDRWKDLDIQTTRYRGKKVEMEWGEYLGWRAWADVRRA